MTSKETQVVKAIMKHWRWGLFSVEDVVYDFNRDFCIRSRFLVNFDVVKWLSECPDEFEIEDGVVYHFLESMPFDRHDDFKGWIHATGREFWNGSQWETEYCLPDD